MIIFNGHKKYKLPIMCDIFHPAIRLLKPVRFLSENYLEPNFTSIYWFCSVYNTLPDQPVCCRVCVALLWVYCVVNCTCISLFFFWSLNCLSFDLRLLISPLVSSSGTLVCCCYVCPVIPLLYFEEEFDTLCSWWEQTNSVKPAHVVTSIKQSHVLKSHLFLVLS